MIGPLYRLGRPFLFGLDAEAAHGLSLRALGCGLPLGLPVRSSPRLGVTLAGLTFPNPLGMAAGYDKNGEVPDALLALGFGFVEVGTVTPLPQAGNPRPRVFRLVEDRAVINRLGFNNDGHDALAARLAARKGRAGIVGVNIGANKDAADRIADYEAGVRRFAPVASYLTANVSSPNTPGLRNLQSRESLAELLRRMVAAREEAGCSTPIFLKIAPDLTEPELAEVAEEVLASGIEGIIVSNTTLAREGLRSAARGESGGMSGVPLFALSTAILARMRRLVGPDLAIIGAGGVDSAAAAAEKICAGADLVQLYSSMVYEGPALPGLIVAGLDRIVAEAGADTIRALRDTRLDHWCAQPIG